MSIEGTSVSVGMGRSVGLGRLGGSVGPVGKGWLAGPVGPGGGSNGDGKWEGLGPTSLKLIRVEKSPCNQLAITSWLVSIK